MLQYAEQSWRAESVVTSRDNGVRVGTGMQLRPAALDGCIVCAQYAAHVHCGSSTVITVNIYWIVWQFAMPHVGCFQRVRSLQLVDTLVPSNVGRAAVTG